MVSKGGGFNIEPAPDVAEGLDLGTLMKRFCSMHPIKPDAPERYIGKIYDVGAKPALIFRMGYGMSLIADPIKAIFDEFDCPRLEYVAVDMFKVANQNEAMAPGIRGKPIADQYWLMNCYNFYDVIDRDRTLGNWISHRPYDLETQPDYYGPDDPPELFNPQRIILKGVPEDAMFGIAGLSRGRFVSEALFDRVLTSGLFDPRLSSPFKTFNLIADERGCGGNRASFPADQRRPHRLNGRTLYWGNLNQPLNFPSDGEFK